MKDYLNMDDEGLAAFAATFTDGVGEMAAMMNLPAARAVELSETAAEFKETLLEIGMARAHQKSLTNKKNDVRKKLKQQIRSLATTARAHDKVNEPELARLGLKVYDRIKTATAAPENEPHIIIAIEPHRRHLIKIFDFADSTSRAKPKGVSGAEIWVYVGAEDDQFDEKNMRYLGMATRGSLTHTHDAEDVGKQAFYLARWVNKRGMCGGWSNQASATIAL